MKSQHEERFSNLLEQMQKGFEDVTEKQPISFPSTLNSFLGEEHNLSDSEFKETLADIYKCINQLKPIPPKTRKLYSIVIKHSKKSNSSGNDIYLDNIEEVTGGSREEVKNI
ncbi:hypothetical protein [Thalassobacillus sp. C254]|uniref:hypothetical protein n=1 Tax=Thalassobacillus sp. C254 TaxID=1225341 RepID=UPI0006D07372|nr:hypothetical protein [Thalassobacillus sp. C254]